jgi:hypothetical protein
MAKRKPATETPKKKGLAAHRARRRARRNPDGGGDGGGRRANPPMLQDFTHVLLPGFGAYAATRFLQRIVFSVVSKRWPRFGKHAHAASGAAAFGAVWLLAHKIKATAKYHDGIVLGSGIAALQGVAQAYLPKYAWLTSDVQASDVAKPRVLTAPAPSAAATGGDEYSYLEEQLDRMEGRARAKPARTIRGQRRQNSPVGSTLQMAADVSGDEVDDDDLEGILEDGEDVDDLFTGAFADGSLSAN